MRQLPPILSGLEQFWDVTWSVVGERTSTRGYRVKQLRNQCADDVHAFDRMFHASGRPGPVSFSRQLLMATDLNLNLTSESLGSALVTWHLEGTGLPLVTSIIVANLNRSEDRRALMAGQRMLNELTRGFGMEAAHGLVDAPERPAIFNVVWPHAALLHHFGGRTASVELLQRALIRVAALEDVLVASYFSWIRQ